MCPPKTTFFPRESAFKVTFPVLPFLAFSVLPRKNLKFTKDFLSLPNPQNPWKRQRKYQNNQGNSLLKFTKEILKTKEWKDRVEIDVEPQVVARQIKFQRAQP